MSSHKPVFTDGFKGEVDGDSLKAAHPLSQAIYEGTLEKPPWKTLLKHLEEYMNVASATLVLRRPRLSDPGVTVYLYSDSDSVAIKDFQDWGHQDSTFSELPEKKVFDLCDRETLTENKSSDFYRYLKHYDISDLMGLDVYDRQSRIRLRLRLVRMGEVPQFSKKDKARLESIIPLMDKALKLYGAYTQKSFVEEFYEELLGSMEIASLILNKKLEVLSVNHLAQQILSSGDGIFKRRDQIQCKRSEDQSKLVVACRELLNDELLVGQSAQTRNILIGRSGQDKKWDVHIRTIAKHNVVFDDGGPELMLLMYGSVNDGTPSQSRLIEMFGVTPAEAKLIVHLMEGLTLTDAAKALGISRNTARTQLSSIFFKTGVNRQTQLVKLVSEAFAVHWQ